MVCMNVIIAIASAAIVDCEDFDRGRLSCAECVKQIRLKKMKS